MADSSKPSSKSAKSPLRAKVVRSQKIVASPSKSDLQEESDDTSIEPIKSPAPRSHTPGHLSRKSTHDRQRPPAELALRQRSMSASQASSRTPTSGSPSYKPPLPPISAGSAISTPVDERRGTPEPKNVPKRPSALRTASSIVSVASLNASSTGRRPTAETKPPKGKYIPYPPLQTAEDAPLVPPAPPSGMYWSKALVSGAPHSAFRAHTVTLIGSNIYVFGGCDSRTCFNDLYVLDADSFYWSSPYVVGEIPVPLRAMTTTAVGKKLVVFGGGDGPTYYNDVYVLDTVNFRWSKPQVAGDKAYGNKLPAKRRAHTACFYQNAIYVFGGGDGVRALNDIWRLDVSDFSRLSWRLISSADMNSPGSSLDSRPTARGYHTANIVSGKLIVFGGSDGGECFDDVWIWDLDARIWKLVDIPVTYRRLSHTATVVGSYLFVIGGHDGSEYSDDVLLLNLVTMTWDKRKVYGQPPEGRGYHGTILYDSRLILIGGFDGSEVFGDVRILELAVHSYYSQISHFTIEV